MNETRRESPLDAHDAPCLGRAIALSAEGGTRGNRPLGAVIATRTGEPIAQACNAMVDTGDCTAHAEMQALRLASPTLSPKLPREAFGRATM